MRIERIWVMPNKWTFTLPPVQQLLKEEIGCADEWYDPFAGKHSPVPVEHQNDLNPAMPAKYHLDALTFLQRLQAKCAEGILFDPPYSITQATQCYNSYGREKLFTSVSSMKYWAECKNEMARIIRRGGKAICFGWNSMGLGKGRVFSMTRILLLPHGGSKNDTIVTVEIKQK